MDPLDFVRAYLQVLDEEGVRDGFVPVWRIALRMHVERGELLSWIYATGIYRLRGLEVNGAVLEHALVRITDAGGMEPIRQAAAAVIVGVVIVASIAALAVLLVGS
ncbi:MAG: hypothetical protein FJ087_07955 [Deltaproteobacteria bacterium]|nr:hypothetical protein [Deltaproteobacteria bacterium]